MSFRVAVVGAGRMGKLHARVLSELPGAQLVCVVDVNAATAEAVARQRNCQALTDPAAAVPRVDAAVIAVPTAFHVQAARPFVQAGKAVLIEKPLSDNVAAAEELIALASATGASVQVVNERYAGSDRPPRSSTALTKKVCVLLNRENWLAPIVTVVSY